MASGFQYTCSQFISTLQFPSLKLQAQEVTHYLKESNSESTPVLDAPSSSQQALKLFLSALECEEAGAVESGCWGLRRLHQTESVHASELVSLLLTKLTLCHHPLPVVSLMGDLLLEPTISHRYNLHTNQHPLALAFSPSPHSVLSALFSLFNYSPTPPLLSLWPCLTQILIDPQSTTHRAEIFHTLLEILSIPTTSVTVSSSIIRLLLLSAVYESEFSVKIQHVHSLLDFFLSRPISDTLPPSEVTALCYSTLLSTSKPVTLYPLLHKLKRLLQTYSHLLFDHFTIAWLSLSLLRVELVQFASLLADITELVIHSCDDESVSDLTRDSLSLLTFSLLGTQLNLERVRPDISSRYSLLLHGLLTARKRVVRCETKATDSLLESELMFSAGELSVFSTLASFLLACKTDVVLEWCQVTLRSLSLYQAETPLSLCCITTSLIVEFSSGTLSTQTEHQCIIRVLLEIMSHLVRTATNLAPPLIALLLLTMDICSYPEEAAQTLHTISTLSTHPACVVITLRSLLSLTDTLALLPAVLRALISLWKLHDAIYPHIKQLIKARPLSSPEWEVARSLSILDICSTRAAVHGEEMFPLVQDLITSGKCSFLVSVGLSALASLTSAETVELCESLDLLAIATSTQPPTLWEPNVAERAVRLLRLSHKLLDSSVSREQELLSRCVQQLILLLAHGHTHVRAASVSALSDLTPQELILIEPFSLHLRRELSIPECLDLPPDRRTRKQCGFLFCLILREDYCHPDGWVALRELLSNWLREELSSRSAVFPKEHKQEVERGEAALRSAKKVLTSCLPKLKHLTDIPESFKLSPHEAAALLFTGRELWEYSESPHKLMQQYLRLMSRSLAYCIRSTETETETCVFSANAFLIFICGIQAFMRDVLLVYRPHSSPMESLFSLLEEMRCEENPQGSMWLKVGLTLNVKELLSTQLQTAIQNLVDLLLAASAHLLRSPDYSDEFGATIHTSSVTHLSEVAYLALGALGGSMCAHLNQKFSTNTVALFIRTWQASPHSSPQLDALYSLTLYSILNATKSYLLQGGPAVRKLAEISKRCTQQIQEGSYPAQYAFLLLTDDETLIRNKQQESLKALSDRDQLENAALTCSVLTCRLYSMREISPQECAQVIYTFLKLSREEPETFPHYAASILLSHTACYGHVASQLLLSKYLAQLRSLLQVSSNQSIVPLLLGILAMFGAFQHIIYPNTPPTPVHCSLLQQGVRSFLDYASPRVDKQNTFSHLMLLLGSIYSQYSHFADTIRTPSSSEFLPDNILLSPLLSFLEEALQSGAISQQSQQDNLAIIFEVLSQASQSLPNYPWSNLITLYQRNTDGDVLHASLLKLTFKLQSQATEQELEKLTFLLRHWLLDPTLDRDRIGTDCRQVLAENIGLVFNISTEQCLFNDIVSFLSRDRGLTFHILSGLIKLMEEKETTVVQQHKQSSLFSSLQVILTAPLANQLICERTLPLLVRCMTHVSPRDRDKLIPLEGEEFLLLRSHLFCNTLEYHWLKPCITHLLHLPPLTYDVHSPLSNALLAQISLVRTLPFKTISEVCLDLLNLIKSYIQTQTFQDLKVFVFNSVIVLSLVSPEILRMSAYSLLTGREQPSIFLLSEMTHFLMATCLQRSEQTLYIPILKKLYEYLLPFFQMLDDNNCKTNPTISLFSLLLHLRHIEEVVGIKPWAVMGQSIFTHSKLFLD